MVAPPIGSPLALTTRPRITFSGASRKLRAVVPALSTRSSVISVASVARLTRTVYVERPRAQPQMKAAVLGRDLVGDRRPLEPDADLGALDAVAGFVGDAPLHHRLRAIGRVAPEQLAAELGLGRQQAAGHRAPRNGALGRQPRAEVDAVPRILRVAQRRRHRVRDRPAAGSAPAPRTRRSPRGARRSERPASPGWWPTRWAPPIGCGRAGTRRTRPPPAAAATTGDDPAFRQGALRVDRGSDLRNDPSPVHSAGRHRRLGHHDPARQVGRASARPQPRRSRHARAQRRPGRPPAAPDPGRRSPPARRLRRPTGRRSRCCSPPIGATTCGARSTRRWRPARTSSAIATCCRRSRTRPTRPTAPGSRRWRATCASPT